DGQGVAVHECGGIDPVPLDETAVGRAQVGADHPIGGDPDLQVPAGDPGVIDDDVCLTTPSDHGDRADEQVALPIDGQDRVPAGATGGGGRCHGTAAGGGVHPEAARVEILGPGEGDVYGADEHVVLAAGVVGGGLDHFLGHRLLAPVLDLVEVLGG